MGVNVRYWQGAWWVFVNHRGRRRAKKAGDKATALVLARRIREQLVLGDVGILAPTSETFKVFATRWLTDGAASWKASTHRFYKFNLELHIYPVLGATPVASITRAHCRKVLAACQKVALKRTSLQGVQRTLSAVLTQAVEDALLTGNPAFRMGKYVRRPDEPKAAITPLTREESERFLATAETYRPEFYAFFLTALRTGLRLGELLALQWGDLDFVGRFVEVRRNLVSGRMTTPKNHNRRRVDMSKQLGEALELRLSAVKAAALKAGADVPKWVFPNRDGEPLDGDNVRRRVFEKVLTKAKLRHVRIHDLRHTFASHLIQNGESLAYVRDQLGHSSIAITVDTYGHLVPGSNRSAVDRLDSVPALAGAAAEGSDS